jgi:hypothetical protein
MGRPSVSESLCPALGDIVVGTDFVAKSRAKSHLAKYLRNLSKSERFRLRDLA